MTNPPVMPRVCLFSVVSLAAFTVAYADNERSPQYTHLLYPRTGELVLQKIVADDPADEKNTRVIAKWDSLSRIREVHNGRIFCSRHATGTVFSIDIHSGQRRNLAKLADDVVVSASCHALIYTSPLGSVVSHYDLGTEKTTRIQIGNNDRPPVIGRAHNKIALSPDGRRAAVATYFKADENMLAHQFEISIIDLTTKPPTVRQLKHHFIGRNVATGGGDHAVAPSMFWNDNGTILLVAGKTEFAGRVVARLGEPMTELISINADTSEKETICDLPFPVISMMRFHDSQFWRRPDGPLMMRSSANGDLRLDLKNRKHVIDQRLTRHYQLQGEIWTPSLWFSKKQLSDKVALRDISVSPDGEQLVWLTPIHRHASAFSNNSEPKNMWLHSQQRGVIKLTSGRVATSSGSTPASPVVHPTIRWLTDAQVNQK